MVAELLVVTGEAEQVLQAHGRSGQQVTLHTDPVPVTTGHLDDRFYSLRLCYQTGTDTGHSDNSGLAVCNINRIHIPLEDACFFSDHLRVAIFGRPQLTGHGKLTACKYPLQITP